jgi:hypothetical protein
MQSNQKEYLYVKRDWDVFSSSKAANWLGKQN